MVKRKQSWGLSMRILSSNKTSAALAVVSVALLGLPGAAFAGIAVVGVPGPVAGVGLLPVLAVAGGALWLVRRFSSRRQQ
jgi:Flp pilus assembly protein TadB